MQLWHPPCCPGLLSWILPQWQWALPCSWGEARAALWGQTPIRPSLAGLVVAARNQQFRGIWMRLLCKWEQLWHLCPSVTLAGDVSGAQLWVLRGTEELEESHPKPGCWKRVLIKSLWSRGQCEGVLSVGKGQEKVSGAQHFVRKERTFYLTVKP